MKTHKPLIKGVLAQAFIALSASICPVAFCLTDFKSQCGFQGKTVEIVIEQCSKVLNYREYYFGVITTDLRMIHTQKRFWLSIVSLNQPDDFYLSLQSKKVSFKEIKM